MFDLDPVKTPSCDSYNALASGATYPTGATKPEDVVGGMDEAITRESADFKRYYVSTDKTKIGTVTCLMYLRNYLLYFLVINRLSLLPSLNVIVSTYIFNLFTFKMCVLYTFMYTYCL